MKQFEAFGKSQDSCHLTHAVSSADSWWLPGLQPHASDWAWPPRSLPITRVVQPTPQAAVSGPTV